MTQLTYVPNRIIDHNGIADGAMVHVYQSGTTTHITLYSDSACTVPMANPFDVAAGAEFPNVYYTYASLIRLKIISAVDGSITDKDPYTLSFSGGGSGDTITGLATVSSRAVMATLAPSASDVVFLTEVGREGLFEYKVGNVSNQVTHDPQQGIYVPLGTNLSGSVGSWVRLHNNKVTPFMFGAIDCTGSPKLSDEVVYDNIAVLNGMWNIVCYLGINKNILVTMDLSGVSGLGVSSTWAIDTGDTSNAYWNRPTFVIIPGRIVAMAAMTDVIQVAHGNYDVRGTWEPWAGTDTYLNTSNFGTRLAKNGIKVTGIGGSRMGDVLGQGFRRYLVAYDHSGAPDNNNIPIQWGRVNAVQCGTRNIDSVKFAGTYTSGAWTNHPAMNGNSDQRHRMTLPVPVGIDPHDLEVGDLLDFGTPGAGRGSESVGVVKAIVSYPDAHSVTVDVWPWQPVEATGSYLAIFGGAVDAFGANLANNTFELIQAYSCAIGVRFASLFAPKVAELETDVTMLGVQLGCEGGEAMEGVDIDHFHIESCFWTVVDYAFCNGATFGVHSAMPSDARGQFSQCLRLTSAAISGSTYQDPQPVSLSGVSFRVQGGDITMTEEISGKSKDWGGLTNNGAIIIGNDPGNRHKMSTIYTANGITLYLTTDRSQADISNYDRNVRVRIYGTGTGKAPVGSVTIAPVSYQAASITVEGTTSKVIAPGTGFLEIECIYEPPTDNGLNGNWTVLAQRIVPV
jgi:hypothetical protein